jgi:hypothetical protein
MRQTIFDLKTQIGTVDCSAFLLGYSATADPSRISVTLIFSSATVVPSGFANCPTLSTVTITDGIGNIFTDTTLDLVSVSTNPSGVTYMVNGAGLNPALPYTVTVNGCLVKGTTTCSKTLSSVIAVPTTTTTTTTSTTSTTTTTTSAPCTCYTWTVNPDAADLADATGNTNPIYNGWIFVDYTDCNGVYYNAIAYNTTTTGQALGCSCSIPYAYYYKNNVAIPCTAGTMNLEGLCAP